MAPGTLPTLIGCPGLLVAVLIGTTVCPLGLRPPPAMVTYAVGALPANADAPTGTAAACPAPAAALAGAASIATTASFGHASLATLLIGTRPFLMAVTLIPRARRLPGPRYMESPGTRQVAPDYRPLQEQNVQNPSIGPPDHGAGRAGRSLCLIRCLVSGGCTECIARARRDKTQRVARQSPCVVGADGVGWRAGQWRWPVFSRPGGTDPLRDQSLAGRRHRCRGG